MPPANGIRRAEQAAGEYRDSKSRANPDGADVMGINKREEGKKINSNINVTPMVDVMLVLLIIFMVITPMLNNKVNVDLPKADAAVVMEDANKEDAVVVAVTRDGRTFLGGDQVTVEDLGSKISAKLENKTSKQVFMRADTRANYGKVMDAVDGIRSAGVSQLGLLTEKRESEAPASKK
jgi:biopolymer transport protein TolR